MKNLEQPTIPFEVVEAKLSADDDRAFWLAALSVLTEEFVQRCRGIDAQRLGHGSGCVFSLGEASPNSVDGSGWLRIPRRVQRIPTRVGLVVDSGIPGPTMDTCIEIAKEKAEDSSGRASLAYSAPQSGRCSHTMVSWKRNYFVWIPKDKREMGLRRCI